MGFASDIITLSPPSSHSPQTHPSLSPEESPFQVSPTLPPRRHPDLWRRGGVHPPARGQEGRKAPWPAPLPTKLARVAEVLLPVACTPQSNARGTTLF